MASKKVKSGPVSSASKSSTSTTASSAPARAVPATTVSRNSPVPRPSPIRREITRELIAKRAFEIYVGGTGGTEIDNWLRAERELKSL
jgi:hypothetical protein